MDRVKKLKKSLLADEMFLISSGANIFCLSGFSGEGVVIIDKDNSYIVTDFRYTEDAAKNTRGFLVRDIKEGIENIVGKNIKKVFFEEDDLTFGRYESYTEKLSWAEFEKAASKIKNLRTIKTADEIKKIKTAADISTYAFTKCIENMKAGVSEREIALMFESIVKNEGASALSFDTIVASGENSSMPHARVSDRAFEKGDFVTMDFGCVYDGYCSDMTRTIAIGSASDEMKSIYNTVLKAQTQALLKYTRCTHCAEADKAARNIIKSAGYGEKFGHSLGHGVGCVVHENPLVSPKSEDVFENGMVVTDEPGIYIEGKFGVRIEDLVVICDEKPEILSHFQKDLLII